MLKETIFSKNFEDLEGTVVPVLICPMCTSAYDDFVKEGYWWSHNIGSVYETLTRLNASIVLEGIFGVPRLQIGKEGEEIDFDEYTIPLIDGSAAISTLVVPNLPAQKVMYFSIPYIHDSAIFLTSPPQNVKFTSIFILKEPFEEFVWLMTVGSITLIASCLVAIVYLQTKHLSFLAFTAVVRPFLDQGVNVTKHFNRMWNLSKMKFIYGTWLLSVIVLGCCYKSTLISAIVSPRYVLPPRTFQELFTSQYNVGAVLFDGVIEYDIKQMNNSRIPDFLRRVTEYEYTSGDCYRKIFEGNTVCLTYSFLMETFGVENMIDIYGRRMYWQSKDSLCHGLLVNGVSRFYPFLLEPLNRILSWSENSGLFSLYRNVARAKREKKGRQNAKSWIADQKFYSGVQNIETTGTRQFGVFNAEEVITWSDNFLPHNSFLGISFFIFATQPENLQLLTTLSPVVQRKVFLISKDNEILLQKQYAGITNELFTSAIFNPTTKKLQLLQHTIFSKELDDLKGATIPVLVCPMCTSAYDDFIKAGYWWAHDIGSVYETLTRLNASIVLEGTFGVPRLQMGKEDEEVDFDEYSSPLLDGSAAISTLVVPNLPAEKIMYFSIPFIHDSAIFLTGPPENVKFTSILILKEPFEEFVWIMTVGSITLIASCLVTIIYTQTKHLSFLAITAVVHPVLDQGVNVSKHFNGLWNLSMMKFVYGIWLLSVIVLGCCYKSTLISAIVSPRYVLPPRTFSELFRSQYDVGAVLFQGVIEYDIKAMNNSGIADFLGRVKEYDYTNGDVSA
ncbi:unnamed protein product [Allacma fusca]|uniref:Uncharacterized protein n=1 Tax=Allacma fusca TaxID=39272 RepID=A0A8J2LJP9_9HEXA|nr:unnamed protein product [Allacma fusca]